jgi:hypothetical protein
MTVGEKIQEMFPDINFGTLSQDDVIVNKDYSNNDDPQVFIPIRLWNKEYSKVLTSNDTDCVSREDAKKAIIDNQYSGRFCEEHNIDRSINTNMALIALSHLTPVALQK